MTTRSAIGLSLGAVLVAAALVVGLVLFEPWQLWNDDTVDEDLPEVAAATDDAGPQKGGSPKGEDGPAQQDDDQGPEWTELASAEFIDAEHGTEGTARIVESRDGRRELWLEGLETSNGPDLHVWITDQDSGGDCEGCSDSWGIYDDGAYVALGALKGNIGDQRYEIPDDADLDAMRSVVIWCDRFDVAFGTADVAA